LNKKSISAIKVACAVVKDALLVVGCAFSIEEVILPAPDSAFPSFFHAQNRRVIGRFIHFIEKIFLSEEYVFNFRLGSI
jgi:hypothetical protein